MICIVEDDAGIRELVVYSLQSSGFEAVGYDRGSSFFRDFCPDKTELVLLDIMLPGESGLEILKKLRTAPESADIPVIMVTAMDSEQDKVAGLDGGADDYIAKPFGVMELLARIRAVLRRKPARAQTWNAGTVELDDDRHRVTVCGEEIPLTLKEYELLRELMRSGGDVKTREELLETVWGINCEVETRTVDVHIRTLRQKLGKGSGIIETVRGVGYRLSI